MPSVRANGDETISFFVSELHGDYGRLDARRVSDLFGLTLADVAIILGRGEPAVANSPAGASLQPGLSVFERIAALLLYAVGSVERLRPWMNSPNAEFDGKAPAQLLKDGRGELVAQRLERALSGHPA